MTTISLAAATALCSSSKAAINSSAQAAPSESMRTCHGGFTGIAAERMLARHGRRRSRGYKHNVVVQSATICTKSSPQATQHSSRSTPSSVAKLPRGSSSTHFCCTAAARVNASEARSKKKTYRGRSGRAATPRKEWSSAVRSQPPPHSFTKVKMRATLFHTSGTGEPREGTRNSARAR